MDFSNVKRITAEDFNNVKNITAEEFFKGNEFSIKTFKDKYCNIPDETPAAVFYRVASGIASMEKTEEAKQYWTNRWFHEMYYGYWMAGGSILSGVDSTAKVSLMNCTTLPPFEDNLEGIFKNAYFLAKDAAYRQGVGADFSKIRPKGCVVNNSSKISLGPLHWMKFIESIGLFVGQKGRIPAMLLSLKIDHPDIEDFLISKLDLDVIQNANISVQITDKFMEAYKEDKDFELRFEVKDTGEIITKTVKAKELMKKLAECSWKCGEPGVQFIDQAQYYSNSDYVGRSVVSTNACCVIGDTQVLTEKGYLKISELFTYIKYPKIFSYNIDKSEFEWKEILKVWQERNDTTITLKIKNSKKVNIELECSEDHPILTKKGYKEAKDINKKDELILTEGVGSLYKRIFNDNVVPLYDIEVKDNHNFVINGGLVIKNSEQYLEPQGLCNLASINIGAFSSNIKQAEADLNEIASSLIRFLDNVVSYEIFYNKSANDQQKQNLIDLRRCGIGVTNLHGWLLKNNLAYDSDEGISKTLKLVKAICFGAYETSQKLGKEKGNFKLFNKEKYTQSPFIKNLIKEFGFTFDDMRNVCCISIAPTGTISLMFAESTLSTGVEPAPGFYYWKRSRTSGQWQWYFVIPDFIRNELKAKGVALTFEGTTIADNDGKLGEENIKIIDQHFPKDKFKPAHLIDPFKKLELMSKLMRYVDSSISCTYNLPSTASAELIEQIYFKAWQLGVKSVAVYRDKTRQGVIEFEPPAAVDVRFKEDTKKLTASERPDRIIINHAPKRPKTLPCDIHYTQIKGDKWLVLVGKLKEDPYEMFAGPAKGLKLPEQGNIVKTKSKTYILECEGKEPVNILENFNEYGTYAYSKMLQHGTPPWCILDMCDKMIENVLGFNKAMGRVLKKYIKANEVKYMKCKMCGSTNLLFQENCIFCLDCQYSKCG